MSIAISDLERQAISDGSASANSLKTSYWKQAEHISDPELQITYWHDVIRFNGLEGNSPTMFDGIQQAKTQIERMRADRDLFNTCKPSISGLLTDLLLPEVAAQELLANLRAGAKAPKLTAAAARLTAFQQQFHRLIEPSAKWLASAGSADDVENADLGIVAPFGILSEIKVQTEGDRYLTFYSVMESAARLAEQAGLKAVLIPDFAFAIPQNRPSGILSFHTAGQGLSL